MRWNEKWALSTLPHTRYNGYPEEKHTCNWVEISWNTILLERMTNRQTTVIQTWKSGRSFLENECSEPTSSRKVADSICCWQIWTFKLKWEFWKTCIHHWDLESFLILTDLSDETSGDINVILIHYIMKCANIWKICITH